MKPTKGEIFMNEENSTVVEMEAPRKKKRSLWWLKLLLVLCVFAGGTIFGLKLPTMDLPAQLREMLFPTMQTEAVLPEVSPAEAVTATSVPVPKESAKPTAAPKESAKPMIAPKESTAPSSGPAAEAKPEVSPTAESAAPADKKTDSAPGGNEYIGIDAALEAALDHAGVKESDAEVFGVYKSKEDDMAVYSVEFAAE